MDRKGILLEQMKACSNHKNWFVPLQDALEGVTTKQALWNEQGNHSIWQLVNHLIFWNERYLNRFKGIAVPKIESGIDGTFLSKDMQTDKEWNSAVIHAKEIMSAWEKTIEGIDDNKLESLYGDGSSESWHSVIANINIHNAYHIGQIVYIRKTQGSWSSNQGVQ